MTPVYITSHVENAVTLLLKNVRHVQVNCVYTNFIPGTDMRVRFRADLVRDDRVFFAKVFSQVRRWKERGGVLICWSWRYELQPDAVVYAECPNNMETLYKSSNSKLITVINEPKSWIAHETIIRLRYGDRPQKLALHLRRLAVMRHYVNERPMLTAASLRSLLDRQEQSQSSGARASHEGAARSPDRTG